MLYHLVTRWTDSITTGMQRNGPLFGTATVRFTDDEVHSASVRWSENGIAQRDVTIEVRGDSILVRDPSPHTFPRPVGAWAVADYGMTDLLVHSLRTLTPGKEHSVRVFRPYGGKWDVLTVRVSRRMDGHLIESVAAPNDTSTFVVARDGTLVQELRSKYPANERRPLEGTRAFTLYLQSRLPIK